MRWTCPHCNIHLAMPEDRVEGGWSFVRCYQCAGFSLVRKSDQKSMKVNQTPANEKVLLPTSPDTMLMSKEAQNHLNQIQRAAQKSQGLQEIAQSMSKFNPSLEEFAHVHGEKSKSQLKEKLLPIAIGAAGAFAIFSGTFLFLEGKDLWKRARTENKNVIEKKLNPVLKRNKPVTSIKNHLSDQIIQNSGASTRMPSIQKPSEKDSFKTSKIIHKTKTVYKPMTLKLKARAVNLRSGPGLQYPIQLTITFKDKLYLRGWETNWFWVSLKAHPKTRYWIRNDLTKFVRD